jgi:hypothetical protein
MDNKMDNKKNNKKEINYQKKLGDFEKLQYFLYNCYHDTKCDIRQSYKELIYDLIEDGETSMALEVLLDIWPKYNDYI